MDIKKICCFDFKRICRCTATARMRNCNLISSQQRLDLTSFNVYTFDYKHSKRQGVMIYGAQH